MNKVPKGLVVNKACKDQKERMVKPVLKVRAESRGYEDQKDQKGLGDLRESKAFRVKSDRKVLREIRGQMVYVIAQNLKKGLQISKE